MGTAGDGQDARHRRRHVGVGHQEHAWCRPSKPRAAQRRANQRALREAEAALHDAEAESAAAETNVVRALFTCRVLDEARAIERLDRARRG
ncbi:MAG TPA: hypothetical protein VIL48_08605 [Acidimicrobiales bacterium]